MEIRAFFALTLPEPVVRWLADHADTLCAFDKQMDVNWVDSESYHLTLCFLGNVSLEQVEQLERISQRALADVSSLQVHLNRSSYYRVNKQLALVAAMTGENEALQQLHQLVMEIASEAGINNHEEGFKPHVTLGRLPAKNGFRPPEEWPEIDLYSLADSVVLYQSKPGERGSVYTPLFEIPLQDMA